jgi:hypothetical protein
MKATDYIQVSEFISWQFPFETENCGYVVKDLEDDFMIKAVGILAEARDHQIGSALHYEVLDEEIHL